MIPFYRAAAQEGGAGKMRSQHAHVSDGIDQLFPGMAVLIQEALDNLLKSSVEKMKEELLAVVAALRRDFEMAYVPTAAADERGREEQTELREEVEWLKTENERLQNGLSEFFRKEEEKVGEGARDRNTGGGVVVNGETVGGANAENGSSGAENLESESSGSESDESEG